MVNELQMELKIMMNYVKVKYVRMIHILLKIFGADKDLYSEKCLGCSSGVNDRRKMMTLYSCIFYIEGTKKGKPHLCIFLLIYFGDFSLL